MALLDLYFKILAYSDEDDVIVPVQKEFDWIKEIKGLTTTLDGSLSLSLLPGDTTITLPAATINFLYIETDNDIYVKLNGNTATICKVEPSVVGEDDGVFFKTGAITGLVLNNPSATENANVRIFMGA